MSVPINAQPVVVVLGADHTITLPDAIAQQFQPTTRFILLQQNDTLILKRLNVPGMLDLVAAAPDEPALSLDEISDLVHAARAERHKA